MTRLPLILACLCLFVSTCTNAVNPNDPRVKVEDIPTGFHGYPKDILLNSDGLITIINGQTGTRRTFDHRGSLEGSISRLIGSPSGRYVYFILRNVTIDGALHRLNVDQGRFESLNDIIIRNYILVDDEHVILNDSNGCPLLAIPDTCTRNILLHSSSRTQHSLNSALESAISLIGHVTGWSFSFSTYDGKIFAQTMIRPDTSQSLKNLRIWFELNSGGLTYSHADTVDLVGSDVFSHTGRYRLRKETDLYLDDLNTGSSKLIANQTLRISTYNFSPDDKKVVIRVRRSYSNELEAYFGHYLYNIHSGRLFHLFNKAMSTNNLRFSPDMTSILFLATFRGSPGEYLISIRPDGSNAVVLGNGHDDLQFFPSSE